MKYLKNLDIKMESFNSYIKEELSKKEKEIQEREKEETKEINRQLKEKIKEEKEEQETLDTLNKISVNKDIPKVFTINDENNSEDIR